jgi:hypothetical protein
MLSPLTQKAIIRVAKEIKALINSGVDASNRELYNEKVKEHQLTPEEAQELLFNIQLFCYVAELKSES